MGPTTLCQIEAARNALLDFDIVVDDCRHELDRALVAFNEAVLERDRAAASLAELIADYYAGVPAA
jgi:hypothetical protein